ncbi:MAG: Carbohydrate kinase [Candidatus Falkowbacteria bacterium GW2011_GWA2_39_24]|uniref:Carbohydrate kinase n=1 Tax=Candidatus Falkowbacteria bacterium GW2011_GWA2_39_24 TaxID=1618634 RepID=A0A0G0NHA7_9BACT|nr:MAG: Carbohydrate kinase [Candidatus Falkowbacteria bacterium GW2011_GWA2_39_24]
MVKRYDVITVGGATEDITFYVDGYYLLDNNQNASGNKLLAFDYGTKVNVTKTYMTFGGGAANAAVCLASLGLKTAGLITYGSDERGTRILANIKKRGVAPDLLKKIRGEMSGFSFIVIGSKNEHVAFSHRAANARLNITETDLANLKKTDWIFLTSMAGAWKSDLNKIFSLPKEIKIAWNPGELQLKAGYQELSKYLQRVNVLTFNKDEAIDLILTHPDHNNKPYEFLADVKNLLQTIKSWGPAIVVITNNEKGADAYDGINYYHQPVVSAKVKADTTGLGDAFGASFIAGLHLYGNDIKKSLHLAAANAASVLGQQGAQNGLLTAKDLPTVGSRK